MVKLGLGTVSATRGAKRVVKRQKALVMVKAKPVASVGKSLALWR